MADSARLVTGVSPGRSWNFASRSGPLMTAVVRWSMPQLCPKITSLPAQSPYILFKRSRAASYCIRELRAFKRFLLCRQLPTAGPAAPPCRRGSRWPPGRSGDGPVSGPRLPRRRIARPPAVVQQHRSPGEGRCAHPPRPQLHIAPSVPTEQTIQASGRPSVPLREGAFLSSPGAARERAWTGPRAPPQCWNTTACPALPMPSAPC
jgi:hypothetical protein